MRGRCSSNPIRDITHIKRMPVFHLYKQRYHARREDDDKNNNGDSHDNNIYGDRDLAAKQFDNVEFGWNLYDAY